MDSSEDGVTLLSGFIFDVLSEYESMRHGKCAPVFKLVEGLNPEKPDEWVPMSTYNGVCNWIEENIGVASIQDAGRAIGSRAFDRMVQDGVVKLEPSPQEILEGLKYAADVMIRDPKKRGWELRDIGAERITMRRTQTFNCQLQDGLLFSLLDRTKVLHARVQHAACTREGAEYCDYVCTWRE